MEMQMYTQDEIFARTLTPAQKETPGKTDCSGYDTRSKYPELLNSYFEVQRNASLQHGDPNVSRHRLKSAGRVVPGSRL